MAGLMRSFMYVGAITSASLINLTFGAQATDHGLHTLATGLVIGSAALLVATLLDHTLRPTGSTPDQVSGFSAAGLGSVPECASLTERA